MKKSFLHIFMILLVLFLLTGCNSIGEKTTSMTVIYLSTAIFAFLLLVSYVFFIGKRNRWFCILFLSVFVVNIGYYSLSISTTLNMALWANRISYLGSVFLPLSMLMIILNVSKLRYKKWLPFLLFGISVSVFLVAASPGYLDIYYKAVTLENIGGVSVLNKEYGPWHIVYLFYLIGYFAVMSATIIHAIIKKKLDSGVHATILLIAVFVNICVWFLEQLVKIDFEFLSVSYIISELFLLSIHLMIQNQEKLINALKTKTGTLSDATASKILNKDSKEFAEHCDFFVKQLTSLTPTEKLIYKHYLDGKSTKEVLSELSITENTLKFHNKNIYSKLGVTSRKQLLEYAGAINSINSN